MRGLLDILIRQGVPSAAAKTIVVVGLFVAASIASRVIGAAVGRLRARFENVSLDSPLVAIARRETAVVAATGWLPGRFTWYEIVYVPRTTARRVVGLVEQARRRPLAS